VITNEIMPNPFNEFPLGRHVEHDPRSRAFSLDDQVRDLSIISGQWDVYVPVLDQGAVGACVGFATDAAVGSGPLYRALSDAQATAVMTNAQAFQFYSWATQEDEFPGTWYTDGTGTDTGSSGLGGAKAAHKHGFIKGYLHAFSFEAFVKSIQLAPVIVGVNWYDSMFNPSPEGEVTISKGAEIAGGHEFMIYGAKVTGSSIMFLAQNSWGSGWGINGRFTISDVTMTRLLGEQGDVTQFVPLDPAPPTPAPDKPSAADLQLWASMKAWATVKGLR
jgi:hypothetical protein